MTCQGSAAARPATTFAPAARGYSGSIVSPSAVLAVRRSRGAPFSTPSTSFSHISRLAAGNSEASGRSLVSAGMYALELPEVLSSTEKCHGARANANWPFAQIRLASGELFDPDCGHRLERLSGRPAIDPPFRRNFGERHQHEEIGRAHV